MIEDVRRLVDRYQLWLRDRTSLRQLANHVEITTPYLDRHNDFIQIYAKKENGGYILTDDRFTLDDLISSGCKLDSPKRQSLLHMTLRGFGVQIEDDELLVHATEENFPYKKHNLVQAILAVNDLFFLSQPHVSSLFLEDVASWLESIDARFVPNVRFSGKSGYDHVFDFAIAKSRKAPERLLRALNNPTATAAQAFAFAWVDTKEVRPPDSEAFAILNDSEKGIPSGVEDALKSYNVVPVRWSKRETVHERLAA